MQTAIDRVMHTYGMIVNLTADQERDLRERVSEFLQQKTGDERTLAIQGIQYLRERASRDNYGAGLIPMK
jgi:hypothetical protein